MSFDVLDLVEAEYPSPARLFLHQDAVGSSASTIRGLFINARAIAIRCCSPPKAARVYELHAQPCQLFQQINSILFNNSSVFPMYQPWNHDIFKSVEII
ncbi:MAG: hypothetical protein Ct9H300mP28_13390 [Pseudomonadota bacterium]|nr:MAG: hypothetical protein Ct9H300mP28_13390 [Pseudomonadota bacterium]